MDRKKKLITMGVIFGVLSVVGISYAAWILNFQQTKKNTIATSCFDVALTSVNEGLNLQKSYPLLDEDGKKLTPYTFTITNNCESYASYQVNLEVLKSTTLNNTGFIKVMFDDDVPEILSTNEVETPTLSDATTSYKLFTGALDKKESKTHNIRIWLDENVDMDDAVNNLNFNSKITVTASYSPTKISDYDLCVANYGANSIQCSITASIDTSGKCPTVNEDGTVNITSAESTNALVCSAPDDYGTSYYYRGTVENNWVKFGGYYWRILRVNGDNSIRMIYAGDASVIDALDATTKASVLSNGYNDSSTDYTQIGTSPYNNYWKKDNVEDTSKYVRKDNAGVGYMYGNLEDGQTNTTSKLQAQTNTNDSTIKTYIDNWYATNLAGYETYISDTLFCNDRTIQETIPSGYSNLGYGVEKTAYRWYSPWNGIKLTCQEQNDRFTVNDESTGNGDLTYPIGLITTDEAYLAGGKSSNSAYYLYTGNWYWTMTPSNFYGDSAYVRDVYSSGYADDYSGVNSSGGGVRPTINLKSGTLKKGSGSASDPWRVAD